MARRSLARAGAAVLTGSVAMLVATLPALADPPAHGVYVGGTAEDDGYSVHLKGDPDDHTLQASLINLKLDGDGGTLKTYCVQIDVNVDREHPGMTEAPWDSYPDKKLPFNTNRDKINWVLHNSYPAVDADAITKASGLTFHDGLDNREAITATQAAIWHFSDGKDMDHPGQGDADDQADVMALYGWLIGPANTGIGEGKTPRLEVTPATATGVAGGKVGPFTVRTTGTVTELTADLPDGVKITDADGKAIESGTIKDGTKVYLDVPAGTAPGSAELTVKANAHLETGRLFVGDNYAKHPTQSLIVAKGEDTALTAKVKGSWTAKPATPTTPAPQGSNGGGELAETGASIFVPVLVGVLLVGAGVGALLFQRRRRTTS